MSDFSGQLEVSRWFGSQHLAFLPPAYSNDIRIHEFSLPHLSLVRVQGVVQPSSPFRGKGGEGLEAPSLAADFRPWYFGEGARVPLPLPIS